MILPLPSVLNSKVLSADVHFVVALFLITLTIVETGSLADDDTFAVELSAELLLPVEQAVVHNSAERIRAVISIFLIKILPCELIKCCHNYSAFR